MSSMAARVLEWFDERGRVVHDHEGGPGPAPLGEVFFLVEPAEVRTGGEAGKPLAGALLVQALDEFDGGASLGVVRRERPRSPRPRGWAGPSSIGRGFLSGGTGGGPNRGRSRQTIGRGALGSGAR